MKRVIALILLLSLTLSLCACDMTDSLVNTEREVVDAIVLKVSVNSRWGWKYIHMGYEGTSSVWESSTLYDYYADKLGETFPCYLITYTYESGKTKSELVFNIDLWKQYVEEGS